MPKGFKATSSPIQISNNINTTAGVSDLFVTRTIDLQLNPLDNEVFVVTGLKIDFTHGAQVPDASAAGLRDITQACSVSKTAVTSYQGINSHKVIGASRISALVQILAGPPVTVQTYSIQENDSMDAPPAEQEYLDIIATNDYHLNLFVSAGYTLGSAIGADIRLYGYRAKAESGSIYAALVQSEMLSS